MNLNTYPKDSMQEIDEALNTLDLVLRLQIGYRESYIKEECFTKLMEVNKDTNSILNNLSIENVILKHRFRNLVLSSLGTAACIIDKALDIEFGKKDPQDISEIGSLRAIMYMIRCAFAHDPVRPQWDIKSKYEKFYKISIDKKISKRILFKRQDNKLIYEFNFKECKGKDLDLSYFHGMDGFFLLGEYAKQKVNKL